MTTNEQKPLTVVDLIRALSKLPGDMPITISVDDGYSFVPVEAGVINIDEEDARLNDLPVGPALLFYGKQDEPNNITPLDFAPPDNGAQALSDAIDPQGLIDSAAKFRRAIAAPPDADNEWPNIEWQRHGVLGSLPQDIADAKAQFEALKAADAEADTWRHVEINNSNETLSYDTRGEGPDVLKDG